MSGARPVVQRGLEALIKRAEQGASRGVLVHRVDRFARDHTETIITAKRLKDADARLVGVTDGVDSDQPHGKWLLNFMSLQAVPRPQLPAQPPVAVDRDDLVALALGPGATRLLLRVERLAVAGADDARA